MRREENERMGVGSLGNCRGGASTELPLRGMFIKDIRCPPGADRGFFFVVCLSKIFDAPRVLTGGSLPWYVYHRCPMPPGVLRGFFFVLNLKGPAGAHASSSS